LVFTHISLKRITATIELKPDDDYEFNVNNVKTSIGIDKFLSETTDKYELIFKKYQLAIRIK
jgi:hypothetical protein